MYYFIVNATSRTGKASEIWNTLEEYLKEKQIDYKAYLTKYEGHATKLASLICDKADGGDQLVCDNDKKLNQDMISLIVVGGDGTANEVINGMHHFDKVGFGYIATGSGNDLGRGLKLAKDPILALNNILSSKEDYIMDLGKTTWMEDGKEKSSYFAISSGAGMDAAVCKQALHSKLKVILNHLHMGKLTYLLITIHTLFSMTTSDATILFDGEKEREVKDLIFIAGMNQPMEGGGIPMAPKAESCDGKLSVCMVYGIKRLEAFLKLPILVMGQHERLRGFEVVECEKFDLKLKETMVVHADGEYCSDTRKASFACVPAKLRVIR